MRTAEEAAAKRQSGATVVFEGRSEPQPGSLWTEQVIGLLSPIVILLLWELASETGIVARQYFPPPTSIAVDAWHGLISGWLLSDVGVTLLQVYAGFVAGSLVGIIVGAALGRSRYLRGIVYPWIAVFYPIPAIALFPLVLVVFGLNQYSVVLTVALGTFFVVAIPTISAFRNIPKVYLEVGANYGAMGRRRFREIYLPAVLPSLLASLKVAIGVSFLVSVALEFVEGSNGLGYLIWNSWNLFQIGDMYVGTVVVALLGFFNLHAAAYLEQRLVPWARTGER